MTGTTETFRNTIGVVHENELTITGTGGTFTNTFRAFRENNNDMPYRKHSALYLMIVLVYYFPLGFNWEVGNVR